ncbi:hypothetical protein L1049_017646 [Liquidambar formosana]|uniref:Protein kinase domain-containing protein n=1 Tax=Liquidambar formosana TaxID=63359 RepID=A0AAP0S7S0_LIQFO
MSIYHGEYGASGQGSGKCPDELYCDRAAPEPTAPPLHVLESPPAYHPHGGGVLSHSLSGKMKFLCSSGGRILPRPIDGKLRYVGGETRIVSIRKNLTWAELVKKTTSICNQPHTIKYQLPGEDLDALISVSSDEDLHLMIEEYHELERAEGSQRLRLFLISAGESGSPHSFEGRATQQSDADYQYVVAVNGMLDPSPRKSSSGQSVASQASQLSNTFDRTLSFQRDSPTSAHPSEIKDEASSSNLVGMSPNFAPQLLTTPQTPTNLVNQSSPLSPSPVQHRDPQDLQMQFYKDQSGPDVHESTSPLVTDQRPYDNSCCVDATGYYHNYPLDPVPVINYHQYNKYLVDTDQTNTLRKVHFHNCSTRRDFVLSPQYGQSDTDFKSPMLTERAFYSHPEDPMGLLSGSNDLVGPHHRLSHAFSDSDLQEHEDRSGYYLEEEGVPLSPLNFKISKSPSLALSSSSQEWSLQQQGIVDKNQPTSMAQDHYKENLEQSQGTLNWMDEKDTHLGQNGEQCEGNFNSTLHVNPMEYKKNLSNIRTIPSNPGGMVSTSPLISLENSADIIIEYPSHGYQLNTAAPEFLVKSQKGTKDQQCAMTETIGGEPVSLESPGPPPVAAMGMGDREPMFMSFIHLTPFADESGPNWKLHKNDSPIAESLPQNLAADAALGREDFLHNDYKVEKEGLGGHSYKGSNFGDAIFVQSQPLHNLQDNTLPESVVVVEDVTDCTLPGIPSSSTVVPHVEDEASDEIPSPLETDVESITPESDCEDAEGDSSDNDESISDAAIAEIEAGIYGLQIIKNADLEELQELGSGTFGTVYHGKWRGTDVAIKRIKKSCFSGRSSEQERLTKDFWREAQILSKLHHPNVVAFYGVVPDGPGGTLATVTEFMVNGSLRHVLLRKDRILDRRKRLMIAMDAAFGMEYLHLKNIVHFDLKCDNLLVNLRDTQRPICKVGDFGLSRIKRNTLVSGGVRGTLPWMAPELLNGSSSRVSEKVDVFSFGVAMWEILTGEEPYANMHCGAIIGGIVNNTLRPPIPKRCDPEWRQLMENCWSPDPTARPSFTEITNRLRLMSTALQTKRHNLVIR